MNCKPGDLAIRVRAEPGSYIPVGAIVEVLKFAGNRRTWIGATGLLSSSQPSWDIKYQGVHLDTDGLSWCLPDSHLKPISPDAGEDETLQWAPAPGKKVEVPA